MRRAQGFSLLELLLAASLGVVLTTAVVQLFASTSRGNVLLAGQASLQESARHAFDFIARSARGAGYRGCAAGGALVNGLNGHWDRIAEFNISVPVEGFDGVGTGNRVDDWQPSLAPLPVRGGGGTAMGLVGRNRIRAASLRPGSDIVVFRRVEAPGFALSSPWVADDDPLVVAAAEDFALEADDFVVLSDCRQGALFRIGSVSEMVGRATLTRPAGHDDFANRPGFSLAALAQPYGGEDSPQAATVARVVTDIYFIATGAGQDNRGERAWSLWRKTSAAAPAELVQGIDDLQILFGVDATPDDGASAPTRYVVPGDPVAGVIRAVHVSIGATSVDAVTADDRALSLRFSRTIAMRNG